MTGKTHKVGGVCAGVIAGSLFIQAPFTTEKIILTLILVGGSYVGSLLPDIDHPGSTVGCRVKWFASFLGKTFGHRGLTHAPLFHCLCLIFGLVWVATLNGFLQTMASSLIWGLTIGNLSHLFLDMLTVSGIPIFYPFTTKKYRLARFTTGKGEKITRFVLAALTFLVIYYV